MFSRLRRAVWPEPPEFESDFINQMNPSQYATYLDWQNRTREHRVKSLTIVNIAIFIHVVLEAFFFVF